MNTADHPVLESPLWLTYSGDKAPGAGIGIRTANRGFIDFGYRKDSKKIDFGESVLGSIIPSEHARLHFGTKRTLLLGEEMADAYLKYRKNSAFRPM